jgi:hypothetical protein
LPEVVICTSIDAERGRRPSSWMIGLWRPRGGDASTMNGLSRSSYLGDMGDMGRLGPGPLGPGAQYIGGGGGGGGVRDRRGEGGASMTTTRSLDRDLNLCLLRLGGSPNRASMTRPVNGLCFLRCFGGGGRSSITSIMDGGRCEEPEDRGGVLSCERMKREVGSPRRMWRIGFSITEYVSQGSSGHPYWQSLVCSNRISSPSG